MVYRELLPATIEIRDAEPNRFLNSLRHEWIQFGEDDETEAQILRVCRQIRDEALPVVYRSGEYVVVASSWRVVLFCRSWVESLAPEARALLRGRMRVDTSVPADPVVLAGLQALFATL